MTQTVGEAEREEILVNYTESDTNTVEKTTKSTAKNNVHVLSASYSLQLCFTMGIYKPQKSSL